MAGFDMGMSLGRSRTASVINLETNGTFSEPLSAAWQDASGGTGSATGGELVVDTVDGDTVGGIGRTYTVEAGRTYRISFDVIGYTGTGWRFTSGTAVNNGSFHVSGGQTSTGAFSADITPSGTTMSANFYAESAGPGPQSATFDNLVVTPL